jgi:hypothetical protein
MSTESNDPPAIAELDALTTEELRERAFAQAEHRHDVGFFWDLVKHLRTVESVGADDGSAGGIGETISSAIDLTRELVGKHGGSLEPLLRARYIDYLRAGD